MTDTRHPADALADDALAWSSAFAPQLSRTAVAVSRDWLASVGEQLRRIPALEAERDKLLAEVEASEKLIRNLRSHRDSVERDGDKLRVQVEALRAERNDALKASRYETDLATQAIADLQAMTAERDQLSAEVEALRADGVGHIPHKYAGDCPDVLDPTRRDPNCPACHLMGGYIARSKP
ncbi:MAG: hypothetical protein AB9M53_01115 [Leptothrix sp. (in: b-proteobacteria)]